MYRIYGLSVEFGWEYAAALDNLLKVISEFCDISKQVVEMFSNLESLQPMTEGRTQTLQVLIKYLKLDKLKSLFEVSISSFVVLKWV